MADQKLTQLPPVPDPVVDADLVYLVRGTDSYQATIGQVHASITPGAAVWGAITGVIGNQTDLNTALGLKASAAGLAAHIADTANPHATTKTQVGLGNVDNTSNVTERAAVATLTNKTISGASNTLSALPAAGISGVIPIANLATGTPSGTKFIRDDGTLAVPAGGSGTVTSVTSADGNATVANTTTTPVITIVSAPKLTTARNINGVAFDGTGNITVTVPVATGITGLGTGVATALAVNVGSAGAPVVQNGALGTPSSGTLTSATGLPISTGVSGLGSNVATFLATPSSANLAAALTDETGTGAAVFAGSPALTGTPTAPTASAGTNTTQLATTAFVLANPATGSLLAANNLSDVVSASSSIKNLNAVGTYYYSIYDYTSASQRAGTADATSALQSALNAIETAMKANDGGKYILDLRDSILRIDGALVSTNSNNAQITLPALDVFADPQCTLVIRGSEQVSSSYSVIGTIPVPIKGAIIRSTLTTGGGTLPSVIAGRAPTASSWLFTSINLVFENIEIQTIANPLIGGLNAGLVNSMEMLNSSVTTGIYTANDCTVPTHSDAIGVTGPGRGNGVGNSFHNVGVIGFYTGFVLNEHAEGDVMAFACLTAVEVKQTDHAIHLQRIESAHCVTTLRATGGASRVIVDFLAIEHASGAPFVTVNDIEDTNNYMSGKANYATVLAGSGVSTVFTKNGGINFQCSNFGDNVVPYWSTLSGTTPALTFVGTPQVRTLTLSGNTTFTASGYAQGYTYSLFLTGDSSSRTLTFPAWVWLEGAPSALAASKVMQIDLVCTGTTAGSVVAVYGVQQ